MRELTRHEIIAIDDLFGEVCKELKAVLDESFVVVKPCVLDISFSKEEIHTCIKVLFLGENIASINAGTRSGVRLKCKQKSISTQKSSFFSKYFRNLQSEIIESILLQTPIE